MDKSLIFILILGSIVFLFAATDFNSDENSVTVSKEESDVNISSNDGLKTKNLSHPKLSKTYDKNGIYFNYPNDWDDDWLNNLLSLWAFDNFANENYGLMVLSDDSSIDQRLVMEQENKINSNYSEYTVDGKKAYLVSSTNEYDDYSLQLIIEKNPHQSYLLDFYCDKAREKEGNKLFMDIIKTIRIQ
jgi:hypothetical protein